jgi:hypothetical protein
MTVSVPMPAFMLQVFHVGEGFEIVTSKAPVQPNAKPNAQPTVKPNVKPNTKPNVQQQTPEKVELMLQRTIEETSENIHFVITTGAGSKARAKKNDTGNFEISRGLLEMTPYKTLEGRQEFFPVNVAVFTDAGKGHGIRQCGCMQFNPVKLIEAACENKPIEVAGDMYVPSEKMPTTITQFVMTPIESDEWRASARLWLEANADTVATMKSSTLNRNEVANQLDGFRLGRKQRTYEVMGSLYGNVNDPVNINEVGIFADTNGFFCKADPFQCNKMLEIFNENEEMIRKNCVTITRSAIQAVAEVCASYQPIGTHGEQFMTTPQYIQFLQTHTKPLVGSPGVVEREKVFKDVLHALHTVNDGLNVAMDEYLGDEHYEWRKKSIVAVEKDSEKMDLTCGPASEHWELTQQAWRTLKLDKDALLREEERLLRLTSATPNPALLTVQNKLNEINASMIQLEASQRYGKRDCEDGSFWTIVAMQVLKDKSNALCEQVKPFVTKSFLPMQSMFPSDKVDRMYESENDRVEAIHFIVSASLMLTSEALKWQSKPVNGTSHSYKACFGLAAAASMKQDAVDGLDNKKIITREMCESYEELLLKMNQGVTLAGHCFTVLASETPIKKFADKSTVNIVEVKWNNLCETTVPNVTIDVEKTTKSIDQRLGKKNVDISIGGQNLCLANVPHSQARAAIGEVVMNKIETTCGKELHEVFLVDMRKGMEFYRLFSQMGGAQCITGQITDRKNVTSFMDARATADALHSRPSNVSFCTSTIAWGGCPIPSNNTTSVTLTVPLAAEEERRMRQIASELTPLHAMTKEHLAFLMNDMGQVVNIGFENGKFYGSDFTGERLDSETRIALFFIVKLTDLAQSLPKYWKNPSGINALIQSEMQAALPGLAVRVRQIETGMHIMQVVVDA